MTTVALPTTSIMEVATDVRPRCPIAVSRQLWRRSEDGAMDPVPDADAEEGRDSQAVEAPL